MTTPTLTTTSTTLECNDLAKCAIAAHGMTTILRNVMTAYKLDGEQRTEACVYLVSADAYLRSMPTNGALKGFQATMGTVSKKELGFGITVRNGRVVLTRTNKPKAKQEPVLALGMSDAPATNDNEQGDAFLTRCAEFATFASDADKAQILALMAYLESK